jgi:hypothetical protein
VRDILEYLRILFFCKHPRTRCIHGDEIIARNWRRVCCLDCGAAIDGHLPEYCYYTKEQHYSFRTP